MIKKLAMGPQAPQSYAPEKPTSGNIKMDEQFREVAELYEKQFLREMMKTMRSTVQDSGLIKVNQGEKIFREQLDNEYVEKWGDKGGIGLADMIYDQLVFQYGPKAAQQKPQGPVKLDEKSNFSISRTLPKENGTSFEFSKVNRDSSLPEPISMPWSGLLQKKLSLGPDETFLEMWHDNGMKSKFVFKGVLNPIEIGQKLQEGESLGYLSPETKNFFWNVSL